MRRAALVLAAVATSVAAADLAHKALADGALYHERSLLYAVGSASAAALWSLAVVAVRSVALAAVGGIVAGGVAGNVLSLALWPGVPNPLVAGPIAFNLADVFLVAGALLVVPAVAAYAVRNRARLHEPVRLR